MAHVELTAGATYYEWAGQSGDPVVVLVHGISIPSWSWDVVAPALAARGYRVLRYDVYGRGDSAYPRRAYDRRLLAGQLSELLEALDIRTPIDLVGFSFGGSIASLFAAAHPERIRRLVLVAPFARIAQPDRRWLLRLPLIGEWLMRGRVSPALATRGARLLAQAPQSAEVIKRFQAQLAKPGFRYAFLSLSRTDALDDYGSQYAAIAHHGLPVMLVWGSADIDIPAASIEYTRQQLRPQRAVEIEGANHGSILQVHGLDALLHDFLAPPMGAEGSQA